MNLQASDPNAWDAIFRHFNQTHGKGSAGYIKGEKITIKVNLTTCNQPLWTVDPATYDKTDYLDKSDTSPQMIVALLSYNVNNYGMTPLGCNPPRRQHGIPARFLAVHSHAVVISPFNPA